MNLVALLTAALEAMTAYYKAVPIKMLWDAAQQVESISDEMRKMVNSTDTDTIDRLRTLLKRAKRYHEALQSALPGFKPWSDDPNT